MPTDEKNQKLHDLCGVLDQIGNKAEDESDVVKIDSMMAYLKPVVDDTYLELMPVVGCFPVIPGAYSKLNKIDIFITVDRLAQLITAANDVSNFNMIEQHALQIVDAVRKEREKQTASLGMVIDQSSHSNLELTAT